MSKLTDISIVLFLVGIILLVSGVFARAQSDIESNPDCLPLSRAWTKLEEMNFIQVARLRSTNGMLYLIYQNEPREGDPAYIIVALKGPAACIVDAGLTLTPDAVRNLLNGDTGPV